LQTALALEEVAPSSQMLRFADEVQRRHREPQV